ncbi:hypothetical protein ACWDUL_26580 [Nocardia niigatensis]|nr:hypothetical protein [Nocardia niigatensis]
MDLERFCYLDDEDRRLIAARCSVIPNATDDRMNTIAVSNTDTSLLTSFT